MWASVESGLRRNSGSGLDHRVVKPRPSGVGKPKAWVDHLKAMEGLSSTRDRFDLGPNLKGVEPAGRLKASGSVKAMVSHRVRPTSLDEVDGEVEAWLRDAWERARK